MENRHYTQIYLIERKVHGATGANIRRFLRIL